MLLHHNGSLLISNDPNVMFFFRLNMDNVKWLDHRLLLDAPNNRTAQFCSVPYDQMMNHDSISLSLGITMLCAPILLLYTRQTECMIPSQWIYIKFHGEIQILLTHGSYQDMICILSQCLMEEAREYGVPKTKRLPTEPRVQCSCDHIHPITTVVHSVNYVGMLTHATSFIT
jgi:hypothetical protein